MTFPSLKVVVLRCALALAPIALASPDARALQMQAGRPLSSSLATRAELERDAALDSSIAASTSDRALRDRKMSEAARTRTRLEQGDFRIGDRILLRVQGDTSLSDTLVVESGPAVRLRGLTSVPLKGVLRSELRDHLARAIGEYVRNPEVEVVSLMRLAVTGDVQRPGFYSMPFESLVSDAIMMTGGPTGAGDLQKVSVRRGATVAVSEQEMRSALADGATLDHLDLRAGDEIVVPPRAQTNWPLVFGFLGTLTGVATLALTLRH